MISLLVLYSSGLYRLASWPRASAFLSFFLRSSSLFCLLQHPSASPRSFSSCAPALRLRPLLLLLFFFLLHHHLLAAAEWRVEIRISRNSTRRNVRTRGETRSAELLANERARDTRRRRPIERYINGQTGGEGAENFVRIRGPFSPRSLSFEREESGRPGGWDSP